MNINKELNEIIRYKGNKLFESDDAFVLVTPEDGLWKYPKSEYSLSQVMGTFLKRTFEPALYNNTGAEIFSNMDYYEKFKTLLRFETVGKEKYQNLPEDMYKELYYAFLDDDVFLGFLPDETIASISKAVDLDGYYEQLKGNKQRVFIDINELFDEGKRARHEELFDEGYYHNLPSHKGMLEAIKSLTDNPAFEVFVLASYIPSSKSLDGLSSWLDSNLPEINNEHRVFIPYDTPEGKTAYIPNGLKRGDVLIDGFSKNLMEWKKAGGLAIRVLAELEKDSFFSDERVIDRGTEYEKLLETLKSCKPKPLNRGYSL